MTMIKLALRGIRASLGRLVLTTIAIVAGVGFVSGSFILADSLQATFQGIFEKANQSIDAQIQLAELEFGQDTRTIPDSLTDEVAALPEVGEATPGVNGNNAQSLTPFVVLDAQGDAVRPNGPPILALSWDGKEEEDVLTLAAGQPPVGIDQVAIDANYAEKAGVTAGDTITMSTPDGERQFTLSAVLDIPQNGGAYFVFFDFPSAQTLFDKEGQVDTIALSRASGVSTEDMIAAVDEVLPPEATVLDRSAVIEEQTADFEVIINALRIGLLVFAAIALFVGLFIIYNTFAILVNQRLQQIGMLRAIGATRGQIRLSIVVEALAVGIVGSVLGFGFGFVVAELIKAAFQAGGGFPETSTVISVRTLIVSLLVGVVATLISALIPARMAGRVSPVAAMRNEPPSRSSRRTRIAVGSVVLAIGLLALAGGLFGGGDSFALVALLLGVGAVFTFVGVAMLSVLFAGPVVDFVGRPVVLGGSLLALGVALPLLTFTVGDGLPDGIVGWLVFPIKAIVTVMAVITGAAILAGVARGGRTIGPGGSAAGLEGRLARQNAARAPQRTAATATALTIGIALVSTVGVVGESTKASVAETLSNAINAELFIYNPQGFSAFSGDLADAVEKVDGIGAVSRFRANEVRIDGGDVVSLAAFDAASGTEVADFDITDGSLDGLTDNGVIVFRDVAQERSLAVGDNLALEFPNGTIETVTVTGIFDDNSLLNSPFIVDLATYERHVTDTDDLFVGATVAEGADAEAVKTEVVTIAESFSDVSAQDTEEFLGAQEDQIDQAITLVNLLLAFALFVAFLGVVNTIVLSVVERTREIGLLRAVGMTREQVRATIRWESVIVCLFGALLGIVIGVLFAWAAVTAIPDDIIGVTAVPWETVLFAILFAALAGVVAALLPARRAAKLNVLDAITTPGT